MANDEKKPRDYSIIPNFVKQYYQTLIDTLLWRKEKDND